MSALVRLALSLALCLVVGLSPAVAEDNNPHGEKGSKKRADYCADVYNGCLKIYCADLPTVAQGEACAQQCETTRSGCLDAARTGLVLDLLGNRSLSTLAEAGDGLGLTGVDAGRLGQNRLETLCQSVKGAVFALSDSGRFGCVHPDCDGKGGFCSIVCADGLCTGFLPDRPAGALTLIGILQDGDNTPHGGAPLEGPTKNSGDAPATPAGGGPPVGSAG